MQNHVAMLLRIIDCWLFLGEALIFKESVKRPALFFCGLLGAVDVIAKWIKTDDVFLIR